MKNLILILFLMSLGACSSKKKVVEPLGATAQQAATQEAADGMSSPAVPATEQPPAGTPVLAPTVFP